MDDSQDRVPGGTAGRPCPGLPTAGTLDFRRVLSHSVLFGV